MNEEEKQQIPIFQMQTSKCFSAWKITEIINQVSKKLATDFILIDW